MGTPVDTLNVSYHSRFDLTDFRAQPARKREELKERSFSISWQPRAEKTLSSDDYWNVAERMPSHLLQLEIEDELISTLSVGIQVVKYCI